MCGIAGVLNFDSDGRAADVTVVARLNELQRRLGGLLDQLGGGR